MFDTMFSKLLQHVNELTEHHWKQGCTQLCSKQHGRKLSWALRQIWLNCRSGLPTLESSRRGRHAISFEQLSAKSQTFEITLSSIGGPAFLDYFGRVGWMSNT